MADTEMKTGAGVEPYTPLNGSIGNSATLGGRRRKSLKLVTKKKARRVLKKLGMKLRGGEDSTTPVAVPEADLKAANETTKTEEGGRRKRRHTKKTHRRGKRRSLFGMRY